MIDPTFATMDDDVNGSTDLITQRDQLCRLLTAIPYTPYADDGVDPYEQMVARHLQLRQLATRAGHPRTHTVLGGFPPNGVYELAWRRAEPRDELVAMPVHEQLVATADPLLVDPSDGARRLISTRSATSCRLPPSPQGGNACWPRGCTCTTGARRTGARTRTSSRHTAP